MTTPGQQTRETNMPGPNDQFTKSAPTRKTSGACPTCPAAYCSRRILTRRCCGAFAGAGGVSALEAASVSNAEETAGDRWFETDGNAAIVARLGGDDHDSLDREDECKTQSTAGPTQRLGRSLNLTEVEVQQWTTYCTVQEHQLVRTQEVWTGRASASKTTDSSRRKCGEQHVSPIFSDTQGELAHVIHDPLNLVRRGTPCVQVEAASGSAVLPCRTPTACRGGRDRHGLWKNAASVWPDAVFPAAGTCPKRGGRDAAPVRWPRRRPARASTACRWGHGAGRRNGQRLPGG